MVVRSPLMSYFLLTNDIREVWLQVKGATGPLNELSHGLGSGREEESSER